MYTYIATRTEAMFTVTQVPGRATVHRSESGGQLSGVCMTERAEGGEASAGRARGDPGGADVTRQGGGTFATLGLKW